MHVLVTGGAGFIGSHTVEALLAHGARVRVLDNLSSGRRENLAGADVELRIGDIRDADGVRRAMDGITHVMHLAAQVSVQLSVDDPAFSCACNIQGFVHVLDAARRAGVARVVYASSAAVYGDPESLPLVETSPARPLSPYGLEKLANDQYAALAQQLYGLSCMGLRYFNVYGPRQDPVSHYAGVISRFIDRALSGEPLRVFGDGLQTRDFIYVGDIARTNVAALTSEAAGVCNVATGKSVTLLEMVAALREVSGIDVQVEHASARTGDIRHSAAAVGRLRRELKMQAQASLTYGLASLWRASQPPVRDAARV